MRRMNKILCLFYRRILCILKFAVDIIELTRGKPREGPVFELNDFTYFAISCTDIIWYYASFLNKSSRMDFSSLSF